MIKLLFVFLTMYVIPNTGWADTIGLLTNCSTQDTETVTYSKDIACKPGYYLSNGSCLECPERATGVTSADKNTIGITACYQTPTDSNGNAIEYSDNTGSYTISGNCYHK